MPRLYPIVDRATLDARGVSVAAFAGELARAGVGIVQYRDKVSGPQGVLRAAGEISAAFAGRDCVLVMNDRVDLAVLAGWRGVHVGQGDMPVAAVRAVMGDRAVVGVSTHTVEQVAAVEDGSWLEGDSGMGEVEGSGVLRLRPFGPTLRMTELVTGMTEFLGGPDYVAVGPVFGTATKVDAEPVVGLEGVRRARAVIAGFQRAVPLVAIGGITRENCRSVVEAGADSVAVIGGLFVDGMTVGEVVEDFLERLR